MRVRGAVLTRIYSEATSSTSTLVMLSLVTLVADLVMAQTIDSFGVPKYALIEEILTMVLPQLSY